MTEESRAVRRLLSLTDIVCPFCPAHFTLWEPYRVHALHNHRKLGYVCRECAMDCPQTRLYFLPEIRFFSGLSDPEALKHMAWHQSMSASGSEEESPSVDFFLELVWYSGSPHGGGSLELRVPKTCVQRAHSYLPETYSKKQSPIPKPRLGKAGNFTESNETSSSQDGNPTRKCPKSGVSGHNFAKSTSEEEQQSSTSSPFDLKKFSANRPLAKITPAILSATDPEDVLIYVVEPGEGEDDELFPLHTLLAARRKSDGPDDSNKSTNLDVTKSPETSLSGLDGSMDR